LQAEKLQVWSKCFGTFAVLEMATPYVQPFYSKTFKIAESYDTIAGLTKPQGSVYAILEL